MTDCESRTGIAAGRPAPVPLAHGSWKLYALLVIMVSLWAVNFLVGKVVMAEFPVLLAAGIRFLVAGAAIGLYYLASKRRLGYLPERSWRTAAKLLALGLLGVGGNQLCFLFGIANTSVGHASLVIALTPALVLLIAAAAGQEHVTLRKVLGLSLAIAGIAALQFGSGRSHGATFLGDFSIFLAAVTFALFTVAGKRITHRFDGVTVNTFAYAGSGVVLAPLTLWAASQTDLAAISARAWAGLIYMALIPSLLCYSIFFYALKRIPATRISALAYLQPLIATFLAMPLLGEPITASIAGGGLLVLIGVFITERA